MKAVVFTEYGTPDVLKVKEVTTPTPQANELLIRVRAVSVNFGDTLARHFNDISPRQFSMPLPLWLPARLMMGLNKPNIHILGNEFAGTVEAVGASVTRFKPGDDVFGYCGQKMGANAEYLCMAETGTVALKPTNMNFEEAATVPYGALTALNLLRTVNLQPGQKVLINGASGGIGSYAVQLAKYYGAVVTGVCGTPRLGFVKALGADQVIDYNKADFTTNGEQYDLIFDILGKQSFARCKGSLTPDGRYLFASFKMKHLVRMLWTKWFSRQKVICALSGDNPDDLRLIKDLTEQGKLKSVIDRCYPLEQTAEAHRYLEQGHKTGYVVITI